MLGGAQWIPASEDLLHSAFGRACADNRRELANRDEGGHRAAPPEPGRGRSPQHIDVWPDSMWGTCTLCGHGEAGAEHLIIWCPGVAMAWRKISGGQMSLVQTVRSEGAPARQVAAQLIHQASFLHGSLMGRAGMDWQHAGHWLIRATHAMAKRRPLAHDPAEDGADDKGSWTGTPPERWAGHWPRGGTGRPRDARHARRRIGRPACAG